MPPEVKIYVLPASHPCEAVIAAADLKQIPYKRVTLLPAVHRAVVRAIFPGMTVPAAIIDGEKVQGSSEIMRRFDSLRPDVHPLVPVDPEQKAVFEEAEDWADQILQPLTRRLLWAGLKRFPDSLRNYAQDRKLPLPLPIALAFSGPVIHLATRYNDASDENLRDDLAALPAHLDRLDEYVADGLIGSSQPNALDLQIGATLALLMTIEDLKDQIAARACGAVALRLFPNYAGRLPRGTMPSELLVGLHQPAPS